MGRWENHPNLKGLARAINLWQVTFKVSITKRLTAQKMYKLQTSFNGRVHGPGNNACLFSLCATDLPGQRAVVSRGVAMGVTCRPRGEGVLLPARLSDIVGW